MKSKIKGCTHHETKVISKYADGGKVTYADGNPARFKNKMRENFPTAEQYASDQKMARTKTEIREEPGAGPLARASENPFAALKRRAAQRTK